MILRRRRPDGTNHDIDLGPGPVGRPPKRLGHDAFMAVTVAEAASSVPYKLRNCTVQAQRRAT